MDTPAPAPSQADAADLNPRLVRTLASRPQRITTTLLLVLAACLAGLCLQIWRYDFLCDDAFISFRYARNLAEGHGLVFNPGHERVEGYSNLLWVLILAAGHVLGIAPDVAANPLLIVFGLLTVLLTLHFCWTQRLEGMSAWALVLPAALLAGNRTFVMWCTSGLETRLFGLLLLTAFITTIREMQQMQRGVRAGFPWSAVCFALLALTRPDGILFAGCMVLARLIHQIRHRTVQWSVFLAGVAAFIVPVGGQYLFRHFYYGDWLPNTYYAKVGGQLWWRMGGSYLACFALEYAVILWVPLLVAGIYSLRRAGKGEIPILIGAAICPHLLYIASIGGDHFEYRVLDAYLPLLFILMYFGAGPTVQFFSRPVFLVGYAALCAVAGMALPELGRRDFPSQYRVGFPGLMPRDGYLTEFIDSLRHPALFKTPGLDRYLVAYNDLVYTTTRQFVGIRQEEHALFLASAVKQGQWLRGLVEEGRLPRDLHIAIDSVGAIPYYSDLRTLDRVGLTDRTVARQANAKGEYRVMAHDKMATDEYLRAAGVDIAALDNVYLVLPEGHPRLLYNGHKAMTRPEEQVYAELGEGRLLLGRALQGTAALARRLPRLHLRPAVELVDRYWGQNGERFVPVPPDRQFGPPYDMVYYDQGVELAEFEQYAATLTHFQCSLRTNPDNPQARGNLERLVEWLRTRENPSPNVVTSMPNQ